MSKNTTENIRIYEPCRRPSPFRTSYKFENGKTLKDALTDQYDLVKYKGSVYVPRKPKNGVLAIKFFNSNKKLSNIQKIANAD